MNLTKVNGITSEAQELDVADPTVVMEVPAWRRYLGALLCIVIAFAIRYSLTPILGEEQSFTLFIAVALFEGH
jgi:hypothetical protein